MKTYGALVGYPGLVVLAIGLALFGATLVFYRTNAPGEAESRRSRRSVAGIVVQMLGFFAVGFGPIAIRLPPGSAQALEQALIVLILSVLTCTLFFASKRAMGRNWSLVARTRADHELVTSGPFSYVRHPIYSGLFLWLLAIAVAFGHERGLIAGIPLYWIGTALRVAEEERLLRAHFGEAYDAYAARVKRFVPGIV